MTVGDSAGNIITMRFNETMVVQLKINGSETIRVEHPHHYIVADDFGETVKMPPKG